MKTLYETIFKRRSVRKYTGEGIGEERLAKIKEFAAGINTFGTGIEVVFADETQVSYGKTKNFAVAFTDGSDAALAAVGYMLEYIDLYVQSLGLGSLWLGGPTWKPAGSLADKPGYAIMLAIGVADVPERADVSEFDRLPLDKVANVKNAVTEAARLAPSAMNSQPWFITYEEGKVTVEYHGRGVSQLILKNRLSKIDLGIVTAHAECALLANGFKVADKKILIENKMPKIEIFI